MMSKDYFCFVIYALTFAIVAHPMTYKLVHNISKKAYGPNVIDSVGVPTTIGLILHSIVAGLVACFAVRSLK